MSLIWGEGNFLGGPADGSRLVLAEEDALPEGEHIEVRTPLGAAWYRLLACGDAEHIGAVASNP